MTLKLFYRNLFHNRSLSGKLLPENLYFIKRRTIFIYCNILKRKLIFKKLCTSISYMKDCLNNVGCIRHLLAVMHAPMNNTIGHEPSQTESIE